MNTILLQPTDVLFFRDGRPMSGSLAGHTAAWPMPDVANHALHAALHRAELDKLHEQPLHLHRRGRSADYSKDTNHRDRKFGCLLTAGPFPVNGVGRWFFPRPKDAQKNGSVLVTLRPALDDWPQHSSLPKPLSLALANTEPPSKEAGGEPWISAAAFGAYLRDQAFTEGSHFLRDDAIADQEANLGIAIDAATQTTGQGVTKGKIYTAHYLRLRDQFRLGVLAMAEDEEFKHPKHGGDLIKALLDGQPAQIVVGGQQRICTAELKEIRPLPLPVGLAMAKDFKKLPNGKFAVKWVLLSPALWPEIPEGDSKRGTKRYYHPGGWCPNWVCHETGEVRLRTVEESERRRRRSLNYDGQGYATHENAREIRAKLVAAIVPKPLVVTGWALPNASDRPEGGAKPTHLAVAPGAVYYFEAEPDQDGGAQNAVSLANALNWHGSTPGTNIKRRRSTLAGEKGFGLGVCGTWTGITKPPPHVTSRIPA